MTEPTSDEVHPIELTVQALLDSPLEMLNLNLKSLYESQMILRSILHKIESTLHETGGNLRRGAFATDKLNYEEPNTEIPEHFDLRMYLETVIRIRKKLKAVENIINVVETRITRMEKMIQ